MKCENCGANLSFEVKYCPYCGAENKLATQHLKDMERYQKEFAQTKEEVYASTRSYFGFAVRIVILAVLVLVSVLMLSAGSHLYSIRRMLLNRTTSREYGSICKQLDSFLEEKDYLGLAHYSEEKGLSSNEKYENYTMVIRAAKAYEGFFEAAVRATDWDSDYARTSRQKGSELSDSLNWFYQSIESERYEYYPEETLSEEKIQAVDSMKQNIEGILMAQFFMKEEQVKEMQSMSEAKRGYLLEEAILEAEQKSIETVENKL